jgi:hypothetical protein
MRALGLTFVPVPGTDASWPAPLRAGRIVVRGFLTRDT